MFIYAEQRFFRMLPLKGKVAIITGGTKGIGKGIADELSSLGAKVVVSARNKTRTKHYFCKCDVSKYEEAQELARKTIKKFRKIDILVNNAGIYPFKSLKDMTEKDWDLVINVNLKGVFNCTKAVIPFMMKKKYGKIVSLASIAGYELGYDGLVHYCAAKAGVAGFTKAAAVELSKYKINVNAIAPGLILTPGVREGIDKAGIKAMVQGIPMKRAGLPKDIAETAAFLASDESEYLTGQTIVVDGGITIQ